MEKSSDDIRAAIGSLRWKQKDLAKKANIDVNTVSRVLNSSKNDDQRRKDTIRIIVKTISDAGYKWPVVETKKKKTPS